jgi:hypothetical protein
MQQTVLDDPILGPKSLVFQFCLEYFLIPTNADQQVKFLADGFKPQNGQELPV